MTLPPEIWILLVIGVLIAYGLGNLNNHND